MALAKAIFKQIDITYSFNFFKIFFLKIMKDSGLKKVLLYLYLFVLLLRLFAVFFAYFGSSSPNSIDMTLGLVLIILIFNVVSSFVSLTFWLLVIEFLISIFKYLALKFYHKAESVKYFFNKKDFGWEVNKNKLTFDISLINKIEDCCGYLIITIKPKDRVIFIKTNEDKNFVNKVKRHPSYKKFFIN